MRERVLAMKAIWTGDEANGQSNSSRSHRGGH
jgi:hypothetical protein